jgi:hypothetical protein
MAGSLDNLSAEGLSQLSKTINEAKELLKQQELLLERTLEMEQRIIGRRVAGLKEYADVYSKMLNNMTTEHASLSAEMFKINEAGKEAAAAAEKAASNSGSKGGNQSKVGGNRSAKQTVDDSARASMEDAESAERENFAEIYKARKEAIFSEKQLKAAFDAQEKERIKARSNLEKQAYSAVLNAYMAKEQAMGQSDEAKRARLSSIKEVELNNIAEVAKAEQSFYDLKNEMMAELAYANGVIDENGGTNDAARQAAAEARLKQMQAIEDAKALNEIKKQMEAERAELIYQKQLEHNGELHAADLAAIDQQMAEKYSSEAALQEEIKKIQKKQFEENKKAREEEEKELRKSNKEKARKERDKRPGEEYEARIASASKLGGLSKEDNLMSRFQTMKDVIEDKQEDGMSKAKATADVIASALSSIVKQLENHVDKIAENKGLVDTRLNGSSAKTSSGSYWNQILKDITAVGAINPFFKQEDFAAKIKELVAEGIAFDLEQRAFLATIKDKIATTFDVTNGTLLRLIRIQQQDSTAGRMGMEVALNAFLNEMYENTEYLKTVATSVKSSLEEMEALMEGDVATEVEYQVQKWLGSLYSVGMSQDAVNKISTSLGQIAAGQIDGLTGDGAGNLLIMAANEAGLSIADILTDGLDASDTNKLMQAVVNYLAEIAESSKDSQIVQQQLANVFGVKASDLRAATNLATKDSIKAVYGNSMTYDSMLNTLFAMAGSMSKRTSAGEAMTNIWNNTLYSLAGGIASSPISYGLLKSATLLDEATGGGIDLPFLNVMGFGVDLNTSVADLMRVGALAGGMIGSFGSMVSGLGNSFDGRKMLDQLGINSGAGLAVTPRGSGGLLSSAGGGEQATSGSGYVGNSSGSDIKDSTMQEAEDSKKQLMVEAKEEEEANQVDVLNQTVIKMYELLEEVASGKSSFSVKVEGYGLTKAGSGSGPIAGVNALDSLSSGINNNSSNSSSGLSGGGVNSGGLGGSVSLSGWTTTI